MPTEIVEFKYKFEIDYQHIDHLEQILEKLKETPISYEVEGAGRASDKKIYPYNYKLKGKGEVIKK